MEYTIEERVARGVKLLDEKMPGWRSKIDLDDLNMASASYCILGQLGGYRPDGKRGYIYMVELLGIEGNRDLQASYGFDTTNDEADGTVEFYVFSLLADEWYKVLA